MAKKSPIIETQEPTTLQIVEQSKVELRKQLEVRFLPYREAASKLKVELDSIKVTDEKQTMLMMKNGLLRKQLQRARIDTEKLHKALKADALATGQLLDTIKREMLELITPLEAQADLNEKFVEYREQERKAKLREERLDILNQYMAHHEALVIQVEEMTEMVFNAVVAGAKLQQQQRKDEAERQANALKENEKLKEKLKATQTENKSLRAAVDEGDPFAAAKKNKPAEVKLATDGEYHLTGPKDSKPFIVTVVNGRIQKWNW